MQYKMLFAVTAVLAIFCANAARADYNPSTAFSPASNPNGVWSYGWSLTLGSAFVADTAHQNASGIDYWTGSIDTQNAPGGFPLIGHNATSQTITYAGTVTVVPGQLYQHPGPDGEYSDLRFTAPSTGTYSVAALYTGLDFQGPTTTDVHVLLDGTSLFNGAINSYGGTSSFGQIESLKAGDTIDFAVGYGSNDNYFYDSTGLTADINTVPEPTSAIMVLMSSMLLLRRRIIARRHPFNHSQGSAPPEGWRSAGKTRCFADRFFQLRIPQ